MRLTTPINSDASRSHAGMWKLAKPLTVWGENRRLRRRLVFTVARVWHSHGLRPHRVESLALSRNPDFAAKLCDVGGLCTAPPLKALILCAGEKSQIPALDRMQPALSL